jgi:hypothetical protein
MTPEKIILTIGLVKYEPGWEIILNQIGVSWKVVTSFDEFLSENYSVIIVNSECDEVGRKGLLAFLSDGGSILSVYGYGGSLLSLSRRKKFFTSLPPVQMEYAVTNDILDIFSYGYVFDDQKIISLHTLSNGTIINVPFDLAALFIQQKRSRKNFYNQSARLPNEVVSTVSKGALRTLISSVLEFLHHRRTLPYLHKWYFPYNTKTIFTFRIDTDKGSQNDIEELFQLSERHRIPTTWFLDVKSHEQWVSYFSKFKHQEIGLHCYEHKTFETVEENFKNFDRGLKLLKTASLNVFGASAPRGNWNRAISSALERLALQYSSEFSYDYDNVPSYPWLGDAFSTLVQLPVHPICPGTLRRAGITGKEQIEYFTSLIDRKIALREPICLYHHPTHHYHEVFDAIFTYIQEKKIPTCSYMQYALWWKRRSENMCEFIYHRAVETITSNFHTQFDDVWYRIVPAARKEALVQYKDKYVISEIQFGEYHPQQALPPDIMRARRFDWRHPMIDLLEFYYKRKE